MTYILIDAAGSPVPLPFHDTDDGGNTVTINNFRPTARAAGEVFVTWDDSRDSGWYEWEGLKVITEAEYMEKQS